MDANGVLSAAYDSVTASLRTSVTTGSVKNVKDENGVWDAVFDPATNSIRMKVV